MNQKFNFKASLNMVCAVSEKYISRREIMQYFEKEFDKDKEFTPEELKQIVRDLTTKKGKIGGDNSIATKVYKPKIEELEK